MGNESANNQVYDIEVEVAVASMNNADEATEKGGIMTGNLGLRFPQNL